MLLFDDVSFAPFILFLIRSRWRKQYRFLVRLGGRCNATLGNHAWPMRALRGGRCTSSVLAPRICLVYFGKHCPATAPQLPTSYHVHSITGCQQRTSPCLCIRANEYIQYSSTSITRLTKPRQARRFSSTNPSEANNPRLYALDTCRGVHRRRIMGFSEAPDTVPPSLKLQTQREPETHPLSETSQ